MAKKHEAQMKLCDAKKTVYSIQGHEVNIFHYGKSWGFWSISSSICSVNMHKSDVIGDLLTCPEGSLDGKLVWKNLSLWSAGH